MDGGCGIDLHPRWLARLLHLSWLELGVTENVDEGDGVSLYKLEGYLAQGWPLIILVGAKLYEILIVTEYKK